MEKCRDSKYWLLKAPGKWIIVALSWRPSKHLAKHDKDPKESSDSKDGKLI